MISKREEKFWCGGKRERSDVMQKYSELYRYIQIIMAQYQQQNITTIPSIK